MSFEGFFEKTAKLLEMQADEFDRNSEKKVAASREELAARLEPAFAQYERMTGEKLAAEQREAILADGNSPLIPVLEKLAESGEEAVGMGSPEPAPRSKEASEEDIAPAPVGQAPQRRRTPRRGKRRDAQQIKQASRESEALMSHRYVQDQ